MITAYQKYELFGATIVEKIVLQPPFEMTIPAGEYACFMYLIAGTIVLKQAYETAQLPSQDSLLLNCKNFTKQIAHTQEQQTHQVLLIHFHPHILKRIYQSELPAVLQKPLNPVSNISSHQINNDFLIQKYIEGLLFYFENPALVNDDILILKLKEIILLLSQTRNAEQVFKIFSQLFSPGVYTLMQVVEAHLFTQINIEGLARECNLSLSSFKREFARHYNDSPASYIKNKRLEKAAELLLVSAQRITDIAFECGFNDVTNFSKNFFEKYSMSPSSYRQNQITN